jgi:3-isopropylmalate/(R)-2-methylmalate dehydratase small subunit
MSMKTFTKHSGIAAPMLRINIDTDAIIPSREMKRVSKSGLGESLFAGWRYIDRGKDTETLDPGFVLNQPDYADTSILLAGRNMGCGSSREFAVWALTDYGIRAIIAPSFGSIFYTNCIRNGLLPIVLDEAVVAELAGQVVNDPQQDRLSIDLAECIVVSPNGQSHPFDIEFVYQRMLMEGLDAIDITMKSNAAINAYSKIDREKRSWAYLD